MKKLLIIQVDNGFLVDLDYKECEKIRNSLGREKVKNLKIFKSEKSLSKFLKKYLKVIPERTKLVEPPKSIKT